jgi:RNA polymerase sigma factor (TIGR02999 family)
MMFMENLLLFQKKPTERLVRFGSPGEGACFSCRIDAFRRFIHIDVVWGPNLTSLTEILEVRGLFRRDTFATSRDGKALLNQLTELLGRMQAGDSGARDALFAAAYAELHRLARARLREGARDVVLDTTCLVHESYLRFISVGELRAEDRRAFFAYASQVMRSVIVNTARERFAQKRGGDRSHLTLSTKISASVADGNETVLKVHEALEALEQAEPRLAQVAQMRYFGGYSEKEIAETLDVTERTVQRDWEKARLILAETLR